jgi:hypothetical protein
MSQGCEARASQIWRRRTGGPSSLPPFLPSPFLPIDLGRPLSCTRHRFERRQVGDTAVEDSSASGSGGNAFALAGAHPPPGRMNRTFGNRPHQRDLGQRASRCRTIATVRKPCQGTVGRFWQARDHRATHNSRSAQTSRFSARS